MLNGVCEGLGEGGKEKEGGGVHGGERKRRILISVYRIVREDEEGWSRNT